MGFSQDVMGFALNFMGVSAILVGSMDSNGDTMGFSGV